VNQITQKKEKTLKDTLGLNGFDFFKRNTRASLAPSVSDNKNHAIDVSNGTYSSSIKKRYFRVNNINEAPINQGAIDEVRACSISFFIRSRLANNIRLIIVSLLFVILQNSFLSAETANERLAKDQKIVEAVLTYGETVVEALRRVDGRTSLARKLGYARNFKSPYIKPLSKAINTMKNTPVMKAVGIAGAGFTAAKVGDRLGEYAAQVQSGNSEGWQTHADAASDTLAEIVALNPIGLAAKKLVYDKIGKIDEAIDIKRAYDEAGLEALISIAELRRQPDFIVALAQGIDFNSIQSEAELNNAYESVAGQYLRSLETADLYLSDYISSEQAKIDDKICLLGLCRALRDEAQSRVNRAQVELNRIKIRKGKLQLGVPNDQLF